MTIPHGTINASEMYIVLRTNKIYKTKSKGSYIVAQGCSRLLILSIATGFLEFCPLSNISRPRLGENIAREEGGATVKVNHRT